MKTKILIGILVFLILINLATIGTYLYLRATRPDAGALLPGEGFPPGGPLRDPMAQLAPEQRERLGDLMRGFHEETRALHNQVRGLEETTFRLLHQDPVQNDSVDLALRRMADLRLDISRKAARRLIDAKAFLSPEQQDVLFDAIMKARPGPGGIPAGGPEMAPPMRFRRGDSAGFRPPMNRGRPPRRQ
jgi:uncharacterized membrane protein